MLRCRNLVYVSFCYCEHITDAGVELMGHMPSLISLDLTGCCLTDQVSDLSYSYKFSRDVNFAVFADNVWSTKIKSSKIYIL